MSQRLEPVSDVHEPTGTSEPIEVIDRLEGLRSQWWLFSTLCTFVWALIASLTLLALLVLLNLIVPLPTVLLRWSFVLWTGTSVALMAGGVLRALRSQRSLEAAARRIEMTFPQLENHLISLVQWSDMGEPPDGFRQEAIRQSAEHVAGAPIETAADFQTRRARWRLRLQTPQDLLESIGILATELAVLFLLSFLPQWSRSLDSFWSAFDNPAQAATSVDRSSLPTMSSSLEGEQHDGRI